MTAGGRAAQPARILGQSHDSDDGPDRKARMRQSGPAASAAKRRSRTRVSAERNVDGQVVAPADFSHQWCEFFLTGVRLENSLHPRGRNAAKRESTFRSAESKTGRAAGATRPACRWRLGRCAALHRDAELDCFLDQIVGDA